MRVAFFEACNPPQSSHHAKKIVHIGGHARLGDKPELEAAKNFWDALFIMHRPPAPLKGPLSFNVVLRWPWLTKDSKKVRASGAVRHHTKPDLSNMIKTIEDSLGRCAYFTNDSQIVYVEMSKWRGDSPGIWIEIEELSEDPK